jgi:hypothetical protein
MAPRVTIDIVPLEAGCQLTLSHELHPDWADYASPTEAGWTKMLEALAEALGQLCARGSHHRGMLRLGPMPPRGQERS